ncbi:MAG: methionine/alanine import family NSS transporter small subunit [Calditrichaeota bacterium]|nr:methionine/alanine import family NSS transporter small subunit [candidate division KSB1 bacterium]MCZ6819433.1 methionine/alanine import family NSS transporter small subunit [Calditrichota bacterium]TDI82130.1 MAG: methionine/alanine import family NSS transporter small subunit [Caldithrix sp.]
MSTSAIIMMVVILGIVWGGFVATLRIAFVKESRKNRK